MSRKWTKGVMAALGLTAAAALLSGPVKADELADLRANQELLQQRVDQLAQAPVSPVGGLYPGGPPAATAGAGIVGGSFPRSFLVPGTDTSIRVGGTITANVMYFFNGGNPNQTTASTTNFGNNGALNSAPLNIKNALTAGGAIVKAGAACPGANCRGRSGEITFISPQQSKVNFETRTPTAWGEARTFMEFDWSNGNQFVPGNNALLSTDNLVPRLRFAYATLGNVLAGQANSNFSDPDASTDNINFGGNVGDAGVTRIPQVRYTIPLAPYGVLGAFSMSAEAPETAGWTPASGLIGADATAVAPAAFANPFKSPAPDLTFAWYIPQPWGHMDFSAVVRPTLQLKDGQFVDRTFQGYGLHFSGDYKPGWFGWSKDSWTWQFEWGDGIGRYVGGNSSQFDLITNWGGAAGATPGTKLLAGLVRAQTTTSWGGNTGYQHWWTPTLRTNLSGGIMHHDINNLGGFFGFVCSGGARFTGAGGCGLNKELISTEANIIWNPVPFADVGLEYFWGHRLVLSNLKGDVNGVISRFRVNF